MTKAKIAVNGYGAIEYMLEKYSEYIKKILGSQSRIRFTGQGMFSTAEIMAFARDIGRPGNDMWEYTCKIYTPV